MHVHGNLARGVRTCMSVGIFLRPLVYDKECFEHSCFKVVLHIIMPKRNVL